MKNQLIKKIVISEEAREIISGIVELNEEFVELTKKICEVKDHRDAMRHGEDRELIKVRILGSAYRLTLEVLKKESL